MPMTPLEAFIADRLGTTAGPEHPSVIRERERQDNLKAQAAKTEEWRKYGEGREPIANFTGSTLKQLREQAGLSIGDVSRITGIDPRTVEHCEAGATTFANAELAKFAGSVADAILSQLTQE